MSTTSDWTKRQPVTTANLPLVIPHADAKPKERTRRKSEDEKIRVACHLLRTRITLAAMSREFKCSPNSIRRWCDEVADLLETEADVETDSLIEGLRYENKMLKRMVQAQAKAFGESE